MRPKGQKKVDGCRVSNVRVFQLGSPPPSVDRGAGRRVDVGGVRGQTRDLLGMNFADGEKAEFGTSVRVEDPSHSRDNEMFTAAVNVAGDAGDMVGHVAQGPVSRKDATPLLFRGGIFFVDHLDV